MRNLLPLFFLSISSYGQTDPFNPASLVNNTGVGANTWTTPITVVEEFIMYVPNAFTPDGNSHNDTFLPVITSEFDPYSYSLLIFDCWGELIFESHNTEIGWNGTYSDEGLVQEGVYVWQIIISDDETKLPKQYQGHVTVLK